MLLNVWIARLKHYENFPKTRFGRKERVEMSVRSLAGSGLCGCGESVVECHRRHCVPLCSTIVDYQWAISWRLNLTGWWWECSAPPFRPSFRSIECTLLALAVTPLQQT